MTVDADRIPTEQQEAEVLAAYLRLKGYKFTHIPNETGSDPRARARAVRMKRAGVSRGFPDYLIIVVRLKEAAICGRFLVFHRFYEKV